MSSVSDKDEERGVAVGLAGGELDGNTQMCNRGTSGF